MKIRIKREPFAHAFQTAAMVAPARSPKTILQNVKIEALDQSVRLTATDMEVSVRLSVDDVEIETPGAAVIPVSRVNSILRESSDEVLELPADANKVDILGKYSRFELQGQNPDEFPDVEDFDASDYFELPAAGFRELVRRTLFATDAESSRYALSGVLFELDGENLVAVGTDGRRLARMTSKATLHGSVAETGPTIAPARALQLIERMIAAGSEEPIQFAPRENELVIRLGQSVFHSRLVEGRFPKWRDVLPNRTDSNRIEIPVGPMYSALRQAAIVSSEESRGVDFTFENGSLVLSNSTVEVGQSRIELPVSFDADSVTITLDHRYVQDFLKVLPPESTFTFDIENGEQAAYCETADNYGYVVMPLSRDRR